MKINSKKISAAGRRRKLPKSNSSSLPRNLFIVFCLILILPLFTLLFGYSDRSGQVKAASSIPQFQHIFFIMMENKDYKQIIGNASAPYINQFATQNGLAVNYKAIMHPSLPNYLNTVSGTNFGVTTDCLVSSCPQNGNNIASQIETAGKTWKAYAESMTANCQTSDGGDYVQRHNPFVYFKNLTSCKNNDFPYAQFATDLSAGNLPNFAWITPNMIDDMHNGTIQQGDSWLSQNVPAILNSAAYKQNGLLIITWDEDSNSGGNNQVAAILASPLIKPGFQSQIVYNHYSLLRTIEEGLGLPAQLGGAASATAMSDFFANANLSQTPPGGGGQTNPTPTGTTPSWGCMGGINCAPSVTPSTPANPDISGQPVSPDPNQTIPTATTQPGNTNPSPDNSSNPGNNNNNGSNNNNSLSNKIMQLIKKIINMIMQFIKQLLNHIKSLLNKKK